jgi:uncharacterized protein YutE (UPF0331/DUF86 family)
MSPSKISKRIFLDRLAWVDRMIAQIRALPLADPPAFLADSRNVATAESCLRRALEAVFDVGRHILARGFGKGVSEYKEIASGLQESGVLNSEQKRLLDILAGYRNRMVHFYHEISTDELLQICFGQLGDILEIQDALRSWHDLHPEMIDPAL